MEENCLNPAEEAADGGVEGALAPGRVQARLRARGAALGLGREQALVRIH